MLLDESVPKTVDCEAPVVLLGVASSQVTWGLGDSKVADLQCVQLHVYLAICLACGVPVPVLTGWDKTHTHTLIQGNKNNL